MLNFPTNPTGGTADKQKLERLAKFAVEKDLIVISDEIYAELTYEGEHVSIVDLPGMKNNFAAGFQGLCDWLQGWLRVWSRLVDRGHDENSSVLHDVCTDFEQEAAIEALRHGIDDVVRMREQYQKRRDFIVRRFNQMGLNCHFVRFFLFQVFNL